MGDAVAPRRLVAAIAAAVAVALGSAASGHVAPRAPAAADVDAEGVVEAHGGARRCLHFEASGGRSYALVGPRAAALAARLAGTDHPVRVRGRVAPASAAACPGARALEVASFSVEAVYRTGAPAPGVAWRSRRFARLFGARQTVNVLDVDLARGGVAVRPVARRAGTRGQVVSRIARDAGALAAVNGGYFDGAGRPIGLLRIAGRTIATNPATRPPRTALGLFAAGFAAIERVAPGDPYPGAPDALGAGPTLVLDSRVHVTRAEEGMLAALDRRHPRTAAGTSDAGRRLVLVTVDGRTAAGAGATLDELARLLVALGCEDAMNLDGGGSTTMYVRGQPEDGVVNYPSDDRRADQRGERRVANALCVFVP